MEAVMKGTKELGGFEAIAYFVGLFARMWQFTAMKKNDKMLDNTATHFAEMAEGLLAETDDETRKEKAKILLDLLKERTGDKGNLSLYYYEQGGEIIGVLSWKGSNIPGRIVTVSFRGDKATLEFCTGTGKYSTFLELPDAGCEMEVAKEWLVSL